MNAFPDLNFIDRLVLQSVVTEYNSEGISLIQRQGEMKTLLNQGNSDYGIRTVTDTLGFKASVNIVGNDSVSKSEQIKTSTLLHNINDYLDVEKPHPSWR